MTTLDAIERTLEFRADPQRVWRAITAPEELKAWFPDEAELDLRPGGEGWFTWAEYGRFHIRFEEVDPPRRLAWRWGETPDVRVEETPNTLVEWTLTERPGGGTTLVVRESGFTTEERRRENDEGWAQELAELAEIVDAAPVG